MIKLTDLMVYDWIAIDVPSNKRQLYGITYYRDGDDYTEYIGIPITEDILKINFENEGHDDTMSKAFFTMVDDENSVVGVSVYPDGFYLSIIRNFKYGQIKKFVTYVHEIQQALRLCGLTELANNFKIE